MTANNKTITSKQQQQRAWLCINWEVVFSPVPCGDWAHSATQAPKTPTNAVDSCMRAALHRSNPALSRMAKSPTCRWWRGIWLNIQHVYKHRNSPTHLLTELMMILVMIMLNSAKNSVTSPHGGFHGVGWQRLWETQPARKVKGTLHCLIYSRNVLYIIERKKSDKFSSSTSALVEMKEILFKVDYNRSHFVHFFRNRSWIAQIKLF